MIGEIYNINGEVRSRQNILVEKRKVRDHLKNLSTDGGKHYVGPKENECEGVHWICLVQDRDKWLAVMKAVINFRVLLKAGKFSNTAATGSSLK